MCLPCVNIFFFSSLFQQGHTIAHKYLVPAIMQLYIDIEFTGSHTQFYDKFNVRYYISKLMKFLWGMPVYKKSIQEQSEYVLFCRCCVIVVSLFCRCFVVVLSLFCRCFVVVLSLFCRCFCLCFFCEWITYYL